jgi:hypothetical protein
VCVWGGGGWGPYPFFAFFLIIETSVASAGFIPAMIAAYCFKKRTHAQRSSYHMRIISGRGFPLISGLYVPTVKSITIAR